MPGWKLERTAFEAGQDEMILAPRNPTSLVAFSYPELYRTGNLYLRAPQLRVERVLAGSKQGQLRATVGLVAPIGTYPTLDFPGGSVSNGWKRPAVQARIGWQSAPPGSAADQPGWALGVSGHYGRVALPEVNSSGTVVSSFSQSSWAGAIDLDLHSRHFGFDAEGYIGNNLQSLGGGIGQPGRTSGGYFEGRVMATQRLQFNAGLGDDHLDQARPHFRLVEQEHRRVCEYHLSVHARSSCFIGVSPHDHQTIRRNDQTEQQRESWDRVQLLRQTLTCELSGHPL